MASPLAKLRQEALAKQQKQSAPEKQFVANPNSLHLLLAELESDLKVLKTFNRKDEKVNHKREILVPKYREAIEAYLAGDEQFDNPLFTQMVIWLFDIEDLETAIKWCDIAIERGLDTPERFKRDFATFCADEVLAWSERMADKGQSIEPYFSQVFELLRFSTLYFNDFIFFHSSCTERSTVVNLSSITFVSSLIYSSCYIFTYTQSDSVLCVSYARSSSSR
jgi:hypothetical protein